MCGISGFNWKHEERARAMVARLAHRGPDAQGVFTDDGVSLGHNRLSVIDLSPEANQPMFDVSRELAIVFNGEIYNFRELRGELEGKYAFRTQSDTEVLLAAYRQWGPKMVERLNGMFAFVIWNKRTQSFFCARDRLGIKPFYYFWDRKRFMFASELQALFEHDIPRTLSKDAFSHYLRVLYVPAPLTMVEGVKVLPPSHTLTLQGGEVRVARYASEKVEPTNLSYGAATKTLNQKLRAAVERQLVSDVPVGVYLSGGVDSSVVLASMARLRQGIKTFTIGFSLPGADEEKYNHDFELAARTAQYFGTEHHPLVVSVQDTLEAFEEVTTHNSDPVSNPTSIAMYLLARHARKEVTVALTGNASDELFGGYDRYRMAHASSLFQKLPFPLRKLLALHPRVAKMEYATSSDLFAQLMFQKDGPLSRVVAPNFFRTSEATKEFFRTGHVSDVPGDVAEVLMSADRQSWLPDFFFTLSDKMSMASALEERVPFADNDVVSFAASLPRSYKLDLFGTKKILKDAFRSELPSFLLSQPKRGWFSPASKWFRDPEFGAFAHNVLSKEYYEGTAALFAWDGVQRMLEDHIEKREYQLPLLWALLTFQMWARRYNVTV